MRGVMKISDFTDSYIKIIFIIRLSDCCYVQLRYSPITHAANRVA